MADTRKAGVLADAESILSHSLLHSEGVEPSVPNPFRLQHRTHLAGGSPFL
ncbi:MAG: hypothetical protein QOE70_4249 [Chthoniobacter sp.]|nr:hypothetical protein [Chthoniobacter sp.]